MTKGAAYGRRSSRSAIEDQQLAGAERYAKLMDVITWLDALPKTTHADVVAAQRSRVTEELRQIALRRATPSQYPTPDGCTEQEQHLLVELDQTEANIRRGEVFIVPQREIVARGTRELAEKAWERPRVGQARQ